MDLNHLDDDALLAHARACEGSERGRALQVLYRRYYDRVGLWALRVCGDREEAAELAQEVFVKVHRNLDRFRGDSAFSTWLYRVTRNLAIDRGKARARRRAEALDAVPEPVDRRPAADDLLLRAEVLERFQQAIARDLDPLEARVLYLHYVDGVPLADLTDTFGFTNKSGAKAYIVSGRRKLGRQFGRWFDHYRGQVAGSAP